MANQEHLGILKQGVKEWNQWREEHTDTELDLTEADLEGANLSAVNLSRVRLMGVNLQGVDLAGANLQRAVLWQANLKNANLEHAHLYFADFEHADLGGANLSWANLSYANLRDGTLNGSNLSHANLESAYLARVFFGSNDLTHANLVGADLREADLSQAKLRSADLSRADLSGAYLSYADLEGANLTRTNLSEASLRRANLTRANLYQAILRGSVLVDTSLEHATLTNCSVYGVSVWNVRLKGATQENLVITDRGEPTITVDNLKIAQFIYLLLNNAEIRDVIDTVAKKAVLILGRFTDERKAILDAIREALRAYGYVPILFDFDKPSSQDLTETVSTLAHLSRFIIVDLTDPSSAPYEVASIASNHIRPIQALFHPTPEAKRVFAMFPDLIRRYHWVLPPYEYQDLEQLLATLQAKVIEPAELKARELEKR